MTLPRYETKRSGFGYALVIVTVIVAIIGIFGARDKIQNYFSSFSTNEKAVEQLVEKFIMEHPEVIVSSLESMQKKRFEEKQKEASLRIKEKKDEIDRASDDPIVGNPKGDVTLIYFFDYNCGYCKRGGETLLKLIEADKNVRVVYKELPILGKPSVDLANMALAIYSLDKAKFEIFHNKLMKSTNRLDDKEIDQVLASIDITREKIAEILKNGNIAKYLDEIRALAEQLNISAVPAFIIGDEIIPGAVDIQYLQEKIEKLRKNSSNTN